MHNSTVFGGVLARWGGGGGGGTFIRLSLFIKKANFFARHRTILIISFSALSIFLRFSFLCMYLVSKSQSTEVLTLIPCRDRGPQRLAQAHICRRILFEGNQKTHKFLDCLQHSIHSLCSEQMRWQI
jgi:hypothetical protein